MRNEGGGNNCGGGYAILYYNATEPTQENYYGKQTEES